MLRIDFVDRYKIKRPDFAIRIVKHIQATYPKKPIKDRSIYDAILENVTSFTIGATSQVLIHHHAGLSWVDIQNE